MEKLSGKTVRQTGSAASSLASSGKPAREYWSKSDSNARSPRQTGDRPLLLFQRSCSSQKRQLYIEGPEVRIRVPRGVSRQTIGSSATEPASTVTTMTTTDQSCPGPALAGTRNGVNDQVNCGAFVRPAR
jgi:hypothetical protein